MRQPGIEASAKEWEHFNIPLNHALQHGIIFVMCGTGWRTIQKGAPRIRGDESAQLTETGEPPSCLPDFSKHVRPGKCVKTKNL